MSSLRLARAGSRRLALCLAFSATLAGWLVFGAAAGRGAVTHEFLPGVSEEISKGVPEGEETEGGSGETALAGQVSVVDALTVAGGSLWVGETLNDSGGERRIDAFDAASGKWQSQLHQAASLFVLVPSGLAVGEAGGERQVYSGAHERLGGEYGAAVAVFGPGGALEGVWKGSETPQKSLGKSGGLEAADVTGVAFDESGMPGDWASGDVYVSVASNSGGVVDVFRAQASGGEDYVRQLTGVEGTPFKRPLGVAVDRANGDVVVLDGHEHPVLDVFEPVAGMEGVYRFVFVITGTPAGPFESLGAAPFASPAVDGGERDIYVPAKAEAADPGPSAVDEFKLAEDGESATYVGRLTGTPAGSFKGVSSSVGVDESDHHVFVGAYDPEVGAVGAVDAFGPDLVIPDVASLAPSNVSVSGEGEIEAQLNGTVNPLGEGEAECQFVWGTSPALGQLAPCGKPVANGTEAEAVQATLKGLAPGTKYYYRLQASNLHGLNPGEGYEDREFVTPGPERLTEWSSGVSTDAATLHATVDPHGAPARFQFEYGVSPGYGSLAPATPEPVGGSEGEVALAPAQLQGLEPGTTYHYRLVLFAEMEGRQVRFAGPDRTFTTRGTAGLVLPDGREWELVSQPDKHGAVIEPIGKEGVIQAAADGAAITYHANTPTEPGVAGYSNQVQILSARRAGGWHSKDVPLPHAPATGKSEGVGEDYRLFSEDLLSAVVQPAGAFIPCVNAQGESQPCISPHASEPTAYLREDFTDGGEICTGSSCYQPLVTGCPSAAREAEGDACPAAVEELEDVPRGIEFGEEGRCPFLQATCGPQVAGASPDASHIVLSSEVALTATATPAEEPQLYEWTGGRLQLVSTLPEGHGPPAEGALLGSRVATRSAVSEDGSLVFWRERKAVAASHLYATDTQSGRTLMLDAVQGGSSNGETGEAEFQLASRDGSRVFFTDGQQLTPGSQGVDLYECQLTGLAGEPRCALSDLTPASGGEPAEVQGVLGASEDGEYVYFVADGVLAAGAVHGDCDESSTSPEALCNLYVRHAGATSLVAVISGEDFSDWGHADPANLPLMTARVSPDGNWLAFMSDRELTDFDNHDVKSGKPDEELYLYEAAAGRLDCASCNPTGERPTGVEYGFEGKNVPLVDAVTGTWQATTWLAADVPGWTAYRTGESFYQSRYLSDSGRLFFDSDDALVPADKNETWDVYEYEPPGVGSCTAVSAAYAARDGGCIGLISSGESSQESAFLDASDSGGDVFFLTTAQLSPQDHDGSYDVYDAHECTAASPCTQDESPSEQPCESTEKCRPSGTPQPQASGAPASQTYNGPGNVVPAPPASSRPKSAAELRAEKLRRALEACRKKHRKRRRQACEREAQKRYGAKRDEHASKKKKRTR